MTCYLGEGKDSRGGHFQTFNMSGESTSYLGTSRDKSGILELNNEYGIKVAEMGSLYDLNNHRGEGTIMLYDNQGQFGWMKNGKSSNSALNGKP